MDLLSYYRQLTPEARDALAKACGTTSLYLRNVAYGQRPVSEPLALALERETGGLVTVKDTRPDFAALLARSGYQRPARRRAA